MEDFLLHVIPVVSFEILAALTGLYFIVKTKRTIEVPVRYFVYLLCLTVFVEVVATYSPIAYFTQYEYFSGIKGTWLERNYWIYNIYSVVSFVVYVWFFRWYLKNTFQRLCLKVLLLVYIFTCLLNLIISDTFFNSFSIYTETVGSILILLSIILYYYQLLNSDAILNAREQIPFYVSLGTMLLCFVLTPLVIYGRYFDLDISEEFVELHKSLVVGTNVFVYLIYTIGFIICLKKKDS